MMLLMLCMSLTATYAAGAIALPPKVCYTQWFDRDNPSGVGDFETLASLRAENPQKICNNPLSIQATTLTGVPAENIGQVFQAYDTVTGFVCKNSDQNEGCCLDYMVRFGCPCPWSPNQIASAVVDKIPPQTMMPLP